jgi:hypothetical protein
LLKSCLQLEQAKPGDRSADDKACRH